MSRRDGFAGLVDRIVRGRFLKRAGHHKDRRIINIEMPETGKRTIEDIQKRRYKMMMDIFSKLKPLERKRYLETIKKIHRILTEDIK